MSLAFKETDAPPEYVTRTDLHFRYRVSYARIAKEIKEGNLALHLVDGKIQIKLEEAKRVLFYDPRADLFA